MVHFMRQVHGSGSLDELCAIDVFEVFRHVRNVDADLVQLLWGVGDFLD